MTEIDLAQIIASVDGAVAVRVEAAIKTVIWVNILAVGLFLIREAVLRMRSDDDQLLWIRVAIGVWLILLGAGMLSETVPALLYPEYWAIRMAMP